MISSPRKVFFRGSLDIVYKGQDLDNQYFWLMVMVVVLASFLLLTLL
jgi:hypothetical protein